MEQSTTKVPFELCVSGKMASGKDTVAIAVARLFTAHAEHLLFARPLKDTMSEIFDTIRGSEDAGEAITKLSTRFAMEPTVAASLIRHIAFGAHDNPSLPIDYKALQDRLVGISGWTRSPEQRRALQFYGTDVCRSEDANYWVKPVVQDIKQAQERGRDLYITDARFPNEVEAAVNLAVPSVRLEISREVQEKRLVDRDGDAADLRTLDAVSETALVGYSGFDLVVSNERPLSATVLEVAEWLISERGYAPVDDIEAASEEAANYAFAIEADGEAAA